MSIYKVLPLKFPYNIKNEEVWKLLMEDCTLNEIKPVFNRFGLYYDRSNKNCWIETKFGSFNYSAIEFKYELRILNHKLLSKTEKDSIKTLASYKRCPKELIKLLYFDKDVRDIKNLYYSIKLKKEKILKKRIIK